MKKIMLLLSLLVMGLFLVGCNQESLAGEATSTSFKAQCDRFEKGCGFLVTEKNLKCDTIGIQQKSDFVVWGDPKTPKQLCEKQNFPSSEQISSLTILIIHLSSIKHLVHPRQGVSMIIKTSTMKTEETGSRR